jgi:hypothetical protein
MDQVLMWLGAVFDGLAILASIVAVIVHAVTWAEASRLAKAGADYVIPATKFKRWLRVNTVMALLVGLNALRWFVLNDVPAAMGKPSGTTVIDEATWAVCDLLLIAMPIILICNMRAVQPEKEEPRG